MILYFAYGSNLDASHMQYRCPNAGVPNPGCLKGFRLDFTRYSPKWSCGVADVVESEGGEVWGLVYEITKSDRDALDMNEGHPKRYIRSETTIHTKEEELEKVWIYTVREKAGFSPPNQSYLEILKRACAEYKFPEYYAQMLDNVEVVPS